MKQFLKFSGFIAFGLAFLAFILMLATDGLTISVGGYTSGAKGTDIMFGKSPAKAAVLPMIGWILILLGVLLLAVDIILALLKKDFLEKHAKVVNIVLALLFILGGVFAFLVVPTFVSANGGVDPGYKIGIGWVISGIFAILAGGLCLVKALFKKEQNLKNENQKGAFIALFLFIRYFLLVFYIPIILK